MEKSALGKYTVVKREIVVDSNRPGNADLKCKSGQKVVAGGGAWHKAGKNPSPSLSANVTSSSPDSTESSWSVAGFNTSPSVLDLRVVAVCVPASMISGGYAAGGSSFPVQYGHQAEQYIGCRTANELAVAGGVSWGYGLNQPDTDTTNQIESSSITADGTEWYAAVRNSDTRRSESEQVAWFVLCVSVG